MRVLLRVDASPDIGTGHAMRLQTLVGALRDYAPGTEAVFVARHMPEALLGAIRAAGHAVHMLPGDGPEAGPGEYARWLGTTEEFDAAQVVGLAATLDGPVDRIVVDHYGLGAAWERAVSAALDAPLWALDDLLRDHACDGMVDTTYGRDAADYAAHVPEDATVLAGARFALLRPGFAQAREASLARQDARGPVRNLLVSMGGMDDANASARVLEAIEALDRADIHTHVMLGAGAPHLEAVRAKAARMDAPVTVHAGVEDVPALLSQTDLCVGAAGSSTWERCCLGVPTINLVVADNQRTIARNLSAIGAVRDGGTLDGFDADTFAREHLAPLFDDVDARHALSLASREIVDGRGAGRVAREVALRLVPATEDHIRIMFDWQSDPVTRAQSRNPEPPRWEDHRAWSERRLSKPHERFYITEVAGEPSGVVRLEPREDGDYEISVLVAPAAHGRGIGTASIRRILARHPRDTVHAFVKTTNPASQRAFEKSGFIRVDAENFVRRGAAKPL